MENLDVENVNGLICPKCGSEETVASIDSFDVSCCICDCCWQINN